MFSESKWHRKPQPVWKHILEQHPDLWIWLGDGTKFTILALVAIKDYVLEEEGY